MNWGLNHHNKLNQKIHNKLNKNMKFFLESYINQINDFLISENTSISASVSKEAMQAGMREYAKAKSELSKDDQRKNLEDKLNFIKTNSVIQNLLKDETETAQQTDSTVKTQEDASTETEEQNPQDEEQKITNSGETVENQN